MTPRDPGPAGRVAGVVILYHPQDSVLGNVRTILPDVGILYVWDNSPGDCLPVVEALQRLEKISYLTEGGNAGVARPMNIAARKAAAEGYEFLLTMDQDSYATDGMIPTMLSFAGQDLSIGLITPYQLDRNVRLTPPGEDVERMDTALTSGNLVRLEAHASVGGFLEKLFIDYVDTEYCLRLRTAHFGVVRVNRAILSHAEGSHTTRKFFGVTVYPANHSPARFFYRARNRLYLRRLYRDIFPEFIGLVDKLYWRTIIKMLLYEKQRAKKLVMAWRGLNAFRRGDYSPVPTEWK
jgi:rhamnosyltransferase